MTKIKDIIRQSEFCLELMTRLNEDIKDSEKHAYLSVVKNYTQKQNDIRRLRRELLKLWKMFIWYNS